jgi:lysophospholipase L1-like esterase
MRTTMCPSMKAAVLAVSTNVLMSLLNNNCSRPQTTRTRLSGLIHGQAILSSSGVMGEVRTRGALFEILTPIVATWLAAASPCLRCVIRRMPAFKLDLRTAFQDHPAMKTLARRRFGKCVRATPEKQFPIATSQQGRTYIFRCVAAVALAAALVFSSASVRAADEGKWIGTWAASPQPVWNADFLAPINFPRNLWNQTIRQIVRVSIGGSQVRVELSNEYGSQPLMIGSAHIALSAGGGAIKPGSDRVLTFSGNESVTIPPGAPVISDPVELSVPALSSVAVSLFLPEVTPTTTMHWDGRQTAYIAAGNKVGDPDINPDSKIESRLFLSGILVDAPPNARAIVAFGDSITDGDGSTLDANHRWPDFLAERLRAADGAPVAVLNEGISGARVLADRMGVNALARFDEDVLSHPRADTVILMMGINDIGWPDSVLEPRAPAPSAEEIIDGYEQLIARAHDHGMRIIGATLTPFGVAFKGTPLEGFYSADKEAKRVAVNDWIRNSGAFDGVIDFDAVVRDSADSTRMLPAYDKGDNLHPNDAGYKAMADSIDLGLLTGKQ